MGHSNAMPPKKTGNSLGDRIRAVAQQLRQEEQVQIQATSRILGAAAQLAENNDRLVGEVVAMVEEDLDQKPHRYTVEGLKQQFGRFKAAKAHFGYSARGWDSLVQQLNAQGPFAKPSAVQATKKTPLPETSPEMHPEVRQEAQRLEAIELEIRAMRSDIEQILELLKRLTSGKL